MMSCHVLVINKDVKAAVGQQLVEHLEHGQSDAVHLLVVTEDLQHNVTEHLSGLSVTRQVAQVVQQGGRRILHL